MNSKDMFNYRIFVVLIFSLFMVSCGGGSKLSLKEAKEVTLNFQGENFVPPPRGIDELLKTIKEADQGTFCENCDADIEHPDIDTRLHNISRRAIQYHWQGETATALELFDKGIKLFRSLDTNDINTKQKYVLLNRFAMLAQDVGNFSDAVKYMDESIKVNLYSQRTRKGSLVIQYAMLSEIHSEAGNAEEAEEALDSAEGIFFDIQGRIPKSSYKYIPRYKFQIKLAKAKVALVQGKFHDAEKLFRELLIDIEVEDFPNGQVFYDAHATSIKGFYLVQILLSEGRIAEAEAEARKAIEYSLERFGRDTYVTAMTLKGMIQVLMSREKYDEAKQLIHVAENIYKVTETSKSSLELAQLKTQLIECHIAEGDWKSADEILNKLDKDLKADKKAHELYFQANLNWAIVQANNGQLQNSERIAKLAYEYNDDLYGSDHVHTAIAKGVLAMLQAKQGNQVEARKNYREIIPIFVNGESDSTFKYNIGINGQRLSLIVESYLEILNEDFKSGNKKAGE